MDADRPACLSDYRTKQMPLIKSLPKVLYTRSHRQKNRKVRRSACRGSFTLEAVVVFPITAAFWVFILFFFRVMQIETQVQEALYYAGRSTAVEASLLDGETTLLASAEVLFRKELTNYELPSEYISGGSAGISLLESDMSGDILQLRAEYKVKFPIGFFKFDGIRIVQNACSRKWTGKDPKTEEEDPFVYYTDYGSVYHKTTDCSYLNLSIHSATVSAMALLRSKDGSIYYACTACGASSAAGTVYYTDYGTNYHASLTCSGLKRTIHMVRLSEVSGKRACSKCGGS